MNKKLIPLLLASSTLLVACNEEKKSAAATASSPSSSVAAVAAPTISKEDAVAIVNGEYISKAALASLEAEISQRARGQKFPQEQLLEELIRRELLVQDAEQKKLDQSSEYKERIEMAKQSLLSQAALENALKSNPVTEADLKAEYDAKIASKASATEYKARHILIKEKDAAQAIIAELGKGKDFVKMAKQHSTGPSATQGGDLGWFAEGQMVPEFTQAVVALENGKFTLEPVKTQFGWHIILREDSRQQTPPPFETIKEQLRPALQQQKIQQVLDTLEKQAKIEILLKPEVVEKPKAPEAVAAPKTEEKPAETKAEEKTPEATEKTAKTSEKPAEKTEVVSEKPVETK